MRLFIALLTIIATAAGSTDASACCLTDWLFGRTATPYAVGYAPVANSPFAANYGATPYAANYGAVPITAPITAVPVQSTSVLRPAWNSAPVLNSGAYQVQRPVYNNPSVYTGMPVNPTAQTLYRAPLTTVLRGTQSGGSYMGATNQYPTNYPTYSSNYAAAQVNATSPGLPLQVTTPTGSPVTAIPATPVAPIYPATQPRVGGLARFFGSLFGTNYRSSYYRAPVTYYRPVTSVDPVSGTTVTVQQPCTAYTQQLQRTPYSSMQFPQPTTGMPSTTAPGYSAPPCNLGSTVLPSGVGQVGAIGNTSGQFVTPIPSTIPSTSESPYGQSTYAPSMAPLNTAPLSGSPSNGNLSNGNLSNGGSDRSPVDQPRLENRPPSDNGQPPEASEEKQKSYWELQDAADSTAMIHPAQRRPESRRDPISLSTQNAPAANAPIARPIPAPDDYTSPFRTRRIVPTPAPTTDTFEAPPLPPRTGDPIGASSASNRTTTPVREAALVRRGATLYVAPTDRPAPQKRDTTWYPIDP